MPDVYKDGNSPEQRLRDRLRNSGEMKEWPATGGLLETNPTRTYTSIYSVGTQQGVRNQPRGSRAEDVGAGTIFDDNEDRFNATYGLNKPKGLQLHGSLFQRKR
jgi:hypothetical protein